MILRYLNEGSNKYKYYYDGPIYKYGKYLQNISLETIATSKEKAYSNFLYQISKSLGFIRSKIKLNIDKNKIAMDNSYIGSKDLETSKPMHNNICPKCNRHYLNDAGECPECDLGEDPNDYLINGLKNEQLNENNLNEKIEKHDTLNPALFDSDGNLLPDVADKIEDIAFKFRDNLAEDGVKLDIDDIYLLGSNASYNYTEDSDIDIHIIANERFDCDQKHLPIIYNAYKSLFNDKYNIKINGFDVEIYVENKDSLSAKSNGIYSVLQNKWIKEPDPSIIPDITEKSPEFEEKFKIWEDKYFDLLDDLHID